MPEHDLGAYRSVPDYIYGITREIWEDRGLGTKLDQYYARDVIVRAPTGVTVGNSAVGAQTLQTLHQFPDRQLVGEDVIWVATPGRAFLSSHRLISVMTHLGDGSYGIRSGNSVRSRIIADCWVQDAQVKEEWLVRDQCAFARNLGKTARELAAESIQQDLRQGSAINFYTPAADRPSRYEPTISSDSSVTLYCDGLREIWGNKRTAAIRDLYFPGATLHAPGGEMRHGGADIDRFVIGYLASFPHAAFRIESAIINREPERPVRIAVRWSLRGEHQGFGHFGEPTGAPVHIMGMAHAYLTNNQVHMEWLVVDEVSVWKQILAHRKTHAGS